MYILKAYIIREENKLKIGREVLLIQKCISLAFFATGFLDHTINVAHTYDTIK